MKPSSNLNALPAILKKYEADILADWIAQQLAAADRRRGLIKEEVLHEQSRRFLRGLRDATQNGSLKDITTSEWADVREFLLSLTKSRANLGFTPAETTLFIFSLKPSLFARMRQELAADVKALPYEMEESSALLDKLGLYTMEVYQKERDEVITRQQQEMLELSTPVVRLWESILALPLIGTLDSGRTQGVMESLLQKIVETGASIAIIDITGVPMVDTLVAQHLLKTVAAARLMGADCIISGIRPQIAQTIVHLGVELGEVTTKANLADALALALHRIGMSIVRSHSRT